MIDPPAVPLAPGWYDDPTSPARLRYYDGAAWTDHTSDKTAPAAPAAPAAAPAQSTELEDTVNDALREGWTVDSRVGDTVVVSKRTGTTGLSVLVYLLLIIFLFPIGLLAIIPWVNESKRRTRFSIRQLPSGEVEQTRLDHDPRALQSSGTLRIVVGAVFLVVGLATFAGVRGGWVLGLPLLAIGLAAVLSGMQLRASANS